MAKTNSAPTASPDLSNDMLNLVATRKTADPTPAPLATPAPAPEPVAQAAPAPVAPVEQLADETPANEQLADNQQLKGKKDQGPAAASTATDYASLFLKPVRGRKSKTIYLSEDMHTALATITQACPDNIGLSDLLINIITHHFDTFGPGIRQFLTAQEKLRSKKLPY